jgi:hypothetical protein
MDVMGGQCSTHGSDEKCRKNLKGRDYLEDQGVDGRIIILQWILELYGSENLN